jgi:hypothetical protein
MRNTAFQHGDGRAQRLHRLRRVVAWAALIVLGLGLASALSAATRDTSALAQAVVSATGAH